MFYSKYNCFRVAFFLFFLLLGLTISGQRVTAQMTESQIAAQEAKWREELAATEKEIAEWEKVLKETKKGTASLERDASILQAKINEAKAFIKKRQIEIEKLTRLS